MRLVIKKNLQRLNLFFKLSGIVTCKIFGFFIKESAAKIRLASMEYEMLIHGWLKLKQKHRFIDFLRNVNDQKILLLPLNVA